MSTCFCRGRVDEGLPQPAEQVSTNRDGLFFAERKHNWRCVVVKIVTNIWNARDEVGPSVIVLETRNLMGVEGIIVARTDAEAANLLDSDADYRDFPFILGSTIATYIGMRKAKEAEK